MRYFKHITFYRIFVTTVTFKSVISHGKLLGGGSLPRGCRQIVFQKLYRVPIVSFSLYTSFNKTGYYIDCVEKKTPAVGEKNGTI